MVSHFAVILISSLRAPRVAVRETLISAVVLCASCVAMFVYGLNLQIPVWLPHSAIREEINRTRGSAS